MPYRYRIFFLMSVMACAVSVFSVPNLSHSTDTTPLDGDEAFLELLETSVKGAIQYAANKGFAHYYGIERPRNRRVAAKWLQFAAERGDQGSQTLLGDLYGRGGGVPQDDARAAYWFQRAAEQGNAMAQRMIGTYYYNGWGVPENHVEAVKWWYKSARQGNDIAQAQLAGAYLTGDGVRKDAVEAATWYRRAAEQGNTDAQTILGTMYATGNGVAHNLVEGYAWLSISMNERMRDRAQDLKQLMTPSQATLAEVLALRYWEAYLAPFQ